MADQSRIGIGLFLGWLGLDRPGGGEVVLRRDTSVGPYSKLVPRLDTSWSPVSIGRFTEDWRYVGVRFLMFD